MDDVQTVESVPNTETQAQGSPAQLSADDIKRMIQDAVAETNGRWQSRFDKLREEKVQTESKAMTVEERMLQLEQERRQERTQWARREAKARAGVDDAFEAAALAYASDDPEMIGSAADQLKGFFEAREAVDKARIKELEQKLQYGTKAPVGGQGPGTDLSRMSIDEVTKYAGQSETHMSEVLAWRQGRKK